MMGYGGQQAAGYGNAAQAAQMAYLQQHQMQQQQQQQMQQKMQQQSAGYSQQAAATDPRYAAAWQQQAAACAAAAAGAGGAASGNQTAQGQSAEQAGYAQLTPQQQAQYAHLSPQQQMQLTQYLNQQRQQQGGQQAQAQQQQQQQPYQQQQQQSQSQGDDGIGNEKNILVSGCQHATVGAIVRGSYTHAAENHGRPAYKKDAQVNGLDVMLYFWDDRDGPNFCGWWFGPKIGGDQVWAYHPTKNTTPPKAGWKVPYDGPVDTTFVIAKAQQTAQQQVTQMPTQQQQWSSRAQPYGQQQQQQQQQQQPLYQGQLQQQQQWNAQEQQRQQLEENRRQLEEANRRRIEEQARREREAAQQRLEQSATLAIRRIIQKVRSATVDTLDMLRQELAESLRKELDNCGTQRDRMLQEAEQGVSQAMQRIQLIKEQQKKMEEQKKELEKQWKAAQERALVLLKELETLIEEAEKGAKTLQEEAEPLTTGKDLTMEEINATLKVVEEAGGDSKEVMKKCTDFILSKGTEMRTAELPGFPNTESKQLMAKLLQRINECTRATDTCLSTSRGTKKKAENKVAARAEMDRKSACFDTYDADKDGVLSRIETKKLARGEFNFEMSNEAVEAIFKVLVPEGKGVTKDKMQRLKVAIGVAREKVMDQKRKKAREAKEQRLAELRKTVTEQLAEAEKLVTAADELVGKVEQGVSQLPTKIQTLTSTEIIALADESENSIKEAREGGTNAQKALKDIATGIDVDLKTWFEISARRPEGVVLRCEQRLSKIGVITAKLRDDARKKETEELYAVEKEVLNMIRHHQQAKELSNEAVFEEFGTGEDGKIDKARFLAFFKTCEKKPKEDKAPADAAAEKKENGESKEGEEAADKKEPPKQTSVEVTESDLERLFSSLEDESEEGEGHISKDRFLNLLRVFMKVVQESVVTSTIQIKDSAALRRLEIGEIVEVLKGPQKEETTELIRVLCKVVKDEIEGWLTVAGNQGTVFLVEANNQFRVVKETILTESFELDGGGSKDATRKLKDTTRKLKEGEVVEVREWARKEPKSGLMRMKCKVLSDGETGWVTTVGNQGTVYMELV